MMPDVSMISRMNYLHLKSRRRNSRICSLYKFINGESNLEHISCILGTRCTKESPYRSKKYSPSYWTYPKIFCITNYFYIDNVVFAIFLKPYITITNCKTLPIPHCFQLSLLPIICLSIPSLFHII